MIRCLKAVMVLMGLLAVSSCITHTPVRTFDSVNKPGPPPSCPTTMPSSQQACAQGGPFPDPNIASTSICTSSAELRADGPQADAHRRAVSCVSHERHLHVSESPTSLAHGGFDLHVLEFDDEGMPWNPAQQDRTFDVLQDQLAVHPAVIVTFVHGWKNDATVCNGNLSCFRDVLEILSKAETLFAGPHGRPRRVIGVYVGWRGGTIRLRGAKQLTFWGRKHTAHVVGDNGAVTAVIERLRAMVAKPRRARSTERSFETTSLVFVGHSFGAALLFSAVATSLNGSVGAAIQKATGATPAQAEQATSQRALTNARPLISNRKVRVRTAGDLVILVNPAMEASRFANLTQTRNLRFEVEQMPIFMTVASDADSAVGGFFPFGQAFATVARSARSRDIWFSMVKGFGLYEPYLTHRLALKPEEGIPLPESVSGTCRCTSNLGAFGDALVMRLGRLYQYLGDPSTPPPTPDKLSLAAYQEMLFSRFEPVRDVDPNNPFIMASVDPAIIGGHSEIFNPRFMDFLIEYIIQTEIKRSLVKDYGPETVQ